jgi:hypothetical protein
MNKMHRDIHIEEKINTEKEAQNTHNKFRVAYIYTCIFVNKEEKKLGKYIYIYTCIIVYM